MHTFSRGPCLLVLVAILFWISSCSDDVTSDGDGDGDADGDTDSDGDADGDSDGDGDADGDSDGDGDADGDGDGGPTIGCEVSPWGLECCDESGTRLETSDCVDGENVCRTGSICTCSGVPMPYACADICGSDIIAFPTCVDGFWQCVAPMSQRTDECPPGTCWGEPGDCACCANDGAGDPVPPDCVDGEWLCPPGAAFCRSCQD